MANTRITAKKQISIGRMLLSGAINIRQASVQLAISRNTVKSYIKKYSSLVDDHSAKGAHKESGIPVFKIEYPVNNRFK